MKRFVVLLLCSLWFTSLSLGCGHLSRQEAEALDEWEADADDVRQRESSSGDEGQRDRLEDMGADDSEGASSKVDASDRVDASMSEADVGAEAPVVDPSAALDAPATTEELTHDFSMSMTGSGTLHVGEVRVMNNLVTIELGGSSHDGIIQERQAWADFSVVLYQTLLVTEEDIVVAWLYCRGDKLDWIYYESSVYAPMENEALTGQCVDSGVQTTSSIDLPEVSFAPPSAPTGFRVDGGDRIQIYAEEQAGRTSFAQFGDTRHRLYPFEVVDCSTDCGPNGWYEIHSFVEREGDDALGFVIFYLRQGGQVEAHYGVLWPGFDRLTGEIIEAEWSTP